MNIKHNIKKFGINLFLLACLSKIHAQQAPQYTQYMYNTNMINPAYAGSRDSFSVFGMYRAQWVGLNGAPKTSNLSVSTPLGESKLGLGINFLNDQLGAMDENNISVDLAYGIDLNSEFKLALGLKGTASLLNVDYTKLNIHNPTDPNSQVNIKNKFTPNIGAGLYMYSDKAYLGISVPNFLQTDRYDDNNITTMREKMHFYFITGYVFELNRDVLFKPTALIKAVSGSPLQVDLTANFLVCDKFTLGTAYRLDASVSALVGFRLDDKLLMGYAYDFDTTRLKNYNSGSHEIFLRFELLNPFSKINAPRFF